VIFQRKFQRFWSATYNFLWVQRRHNCSPAASFANYIMTLYRRCWLVLSPTRKETSYSDGRFWFSYILFIIISGEILVLYIYIYIYIYKTSNKRNILTIKKIHQKVGRAKDLSAPMYLLNCACKLFFLYQQLKNAKFWVVTLLSQMSDMKLKGNFCFLTGLKYLTIPAFVL
jgi:hypothetical protein